MAQLISHSLSVASLPYATLTFMAILRSRNNRRQSKYQGRNNYGYTTENIRWDIMSHLIFCFKTNRPGAWRIGGWGLRRRTRNGEYQVRGFLAPDIPNHCRQLKSFSKSSTGRETLRSGWSAVRNRSSCFPFAWLVMVVFPGGRFSQRTSFCLARCTGRLWCHPRQASRRDAACRARRDNGSHRSRRRA